MKLHDRVKYRREFLRSIGCCTGSMPQARGEVVGLDKLGSITLATVSWDADWLDELPERVNTANLTGASDPEKV